MPDWLVPILTLIGVILGAGISEFRHYRESKERYREMTFEKRLLAHQEALSWCYKLSDILNTEKKEAVFDIVGRMRTWFADNCLFLDDVSRVEIIDLSNQAFVYASGYDEKHSDIFVKLGETREAIIRGIGIQHMPDIPIVDKQ